MQIQTVLGEGVTMIIRTLVNPLFAQKMADINHAAFGYKQLPDISRYQIQERIKNPRYSAYGVLTGKHILGFLYIDHKPYEFILSPKEKLIEHFSIIPYEQGKGIGKMILDYVINTAHPNASFNLSVSANNKAVYLYRKFGFVDYGSNFLVRNKNYVAMGLIR
jgi:GNAT superfamily N-acetyltransferase